MNKNDGLLLFGVVASGLALRLVGLTWGIPDATHYFSFHPDEFSTAGTVTGMLNTGQLNPRFFHYGSLTIYLTLLAALPGHALGWVSTVVETHLIGRGITIALGTGTVLLTFLLGRRLYGRGLPAALILAWMPGHVLHSHFATVDVPATFFVTLALLLSARVGSSPARKWIVAAGASAGLAAATKYTAGIVLLAPFTAAWLSGRARFTGIALAAAGALVAFLAAMPYAILDFTTFWDDLSYELFEHSREGHRNLFDDTGSGWWHHATANLPYLAGIPLLVAALAGVARMLARRGPGDLLLLSFALPYFLLLGFSEVRFLRYTIPLAPVLALAAAALLEWIRPPVRRIALGAVVLSLVVLTGRQEWALTREDPRVAARAWMEGARGSSVGLLTRPWHYSPPLIPWNGGPESRHEFDALVRRGEGPFRFVLCLDWNETRLRRERPDYFVLSEFEWREEERLGDARARSFRNALEEGYRLAARFERFPVSERWMFGGFAPHDWLYPFAEVRIYERR